MLWGLRAEGEGGVQPSAPSLRYPDPALPPPPRQSLTAAACQVMMRSRSRLQPRQGDADAFKSGKGPSLWRISRRNERKPDAIDTFG